MALDTIADMTVWVEADGGLFCRVQLIPRTAFFIFWANGVGSFDCMQAKNGYLKAEWESETTSRRDDSKLMEDVVRALKSIGPGLLAFSG